MRDFFKIIFTSFLFIAIISFKSIAFNIFGETEYYECEGDREIESFKLEKPSKFSSQSSRLYYDIGGDWTYLKASISKDKIVIPTWKSWVDCPYNYVIFRLKDEKNEVNAKGVYIKNCRSFKRGRLHFRTKCRTHIK